MRDYTVVVQYPRADWNIDFPNATYVALVCADDPTTAEYAGARAAQSAQPNKNRGTIDTWVPLVVFEGHISAVKYAWQAPAWPYQK